MYRLTLSLSDSDRKALDRTQDAYAAACLRSIEVGQTLGTTGNARLHAACYRELRAQFGLPANLAIRAIAHAARLLKSQSCDLPPLVEYDARVLSLAPEHGTVSIATVSGRLRNLTASPCARGWPVDGLFTTATLLFEDGAYRLAVRCTSSGADREAQK